MGPVAVLVRLVKLTNDLLYYSVDWCDLSLCDIILLAILLCYNKYGFKIGTSRCSGAWGPCDPPPLYFILSLIK